MPTLNWIGKDKVVNHHQDVPFKVLEHKYTFNSPFEGGKEDVSGNKIIHGDNLEALKSLLPEYEGRIKCIYIDPPYNTGNEKWVYNDNVNHPKIKKWLGDVVGKQGEDLTRHDKWLCMMYPRIKLLHKLLADDGAIFISIDDNEQASLKLMCDEIFGGNNFVANFIWKKKGTSTNVAGVSISNLTEFVICYKKNQNPINLRTTSKENRKFPFKDELGYYRKTVIEKRNTGEYERASMVFEILGTKPRKGKRWQIGEIKAKELEKHNRFVNDNGIIKLKIYKFEQKDTFSAQPNLLLEHGSTDGGNKTLKENGLSFSNPKPTELISHIINISTDKNSIILDSFAGSGTTAHAVLNLNKEDGGNRKFIMLEMEDYAETITAERVKRVINGYGEGKKAVAGTGGSFDYYELGKPIFKPVKTGHAPFLNEEIGEQKIREYIYYTETKQYLTREQDKKYKYLLDILNHTGYYFYYEKDELTKLSNETLNIIAKKAEQYIIYADFCLLDKEDLLKKNIIFKKIPRDIKRF